MQGSIFNSARAETFFKILPSIFAHSDWQVAISRHHIRFDEIHIQNHLVRLLWCAKQIAEIQCGGDIRIFKGELFCFNRPLAALFRPSKHPIGSIQFNFWIY